jgi:hypothetical protein
LGRWISEEGKVRKWKRMDEQRKRSTQGKSRRECGRWEGERKFILRLLLEKSMSSEFSNSPVSISSSSSSSSYRAKLSALCIDRELGARLNKSPSSDSPSSRSECKGGKKGEKGRRGREKE